jgi:DNA-binding PadR family transcriptional regulator
VKRTGEELEPILRRMGDPSWLILAVLDPVEGIPGVEIIGRVEKVLQQADYPTRRLDPSTLHYGLKRMEEDGLICCTGRREVDVPGPRGTTRREQRSVYVVTALGERALERRRALDRVAYRQTATYGRLKPAVG